MAIPEILTTFLIGLGMLLLGLPVAAVMAMMGTIGGLLVFGYPLMDSIGNVVWGIQNEDTLTAIPLFVLMGELLLRTGIADRMYGALSVWVRWLPGSLLHTNIGCCALFAATTGSSVACAATIATVALPALEERKFSRSMSLGSLAAGGTLGILIPPSIALLVYGSLTNNSIGKLFIAGVTPGILLTACFMAYIAAVYLFKREIQHEEPVSWGVRFAALPGLIAPFLIFFTVMGSIYFGLATPTESAALGIMVALFFGLRERRLTFSVLHQCFLNTAKLTGMLLLIVVGAFILNLTVTMLGIAQTLSQWVTSLKLSLTGLLLVMTIFYAILGMFLEVLSMQVATIPITYPIVTAAGADPIWFGIFIVLMSEIALITPPVGMNLYVIQGVRTDGGSLSDVIWGALPFVIIMIAFTMLLIAFPEIALWLPRRMF
jgi:C4-dicarboxylate transporter, DctM subunit